VHACCAALRTTKRRTATNSQARERTHQLRAEGGGEREREQAEGRRTRKGRTTLTRTNASLNSKWRGGQKQQGVEKASAQAFPPICTAPRLIEIVRNPGDIAKP
jgi:hypothetical protein